MTYFSVLFSCIVIPKSPWNVNVMKTYWFCCVVFSKQYYFCGAYTNVQYFLFLSVIRKLNINLILD